MDIDLKKIELDNNEIETIALNVYMDIAEYIKQHKEKYLEWFLEKISENYIQTVDGMKKILDFTYNFELCNYERNRK